MGRIQVFEHEKLTLTPDSIERFITQKQLDKLLDFNDKNKNNYFTPIRQGVKFNQYVGVIQIGNLTIEILPKADKKGFEDENRTNVWRKVLLKMLSLSGNISVDAVSETNLKKRNNSLLDLYFERFVKETESLLRKGLIKKYRNKTGNLTVLKGRLDFSKNIQKNLVHKEKFYTHHQHYDFQHLLNQILIKALRVLSSISTNQGLRDKIDKLLFNFPEIKEVEITKSSFDRIVIHRKSEKYSEAIQIAKMIILNYSPDLSKGQENMLALLFDMNKLWENYIYKILKRTEDDNYKIDYHKSKKFWNTRYVEPDIVIKYKKDTTYIIDTKWKLISDVHPSLEDLKQMYVYNKYWKAPKSMLLYPKHQNKADGTFGTFADGIKNTECKVGFISVLNKDNTSLNMEIGKEILEKFEVSFYID